MSAPACPGDRAHSAQQAGVSATNVPWDPAAHEPDPFQTVAAVITDRRGRVLLVRKHGSTTFIQPGGKREAGETALQTLARELREELAVALRIDSARLLGTFEDRAVNEPGRRVRAEVYQVQVEGEPTPQAEIAELVWIDPEPPHPVTVAPLSARHILPAHRARPPDRDGQNRHNHQPPEAPPG
jgi:8-oxo-dGTP diphosphatase